MKPLFAPFNRNESFFDEDGNLHIILTYKREDYSKDTGFNITVGSFGVLGTKVFPRDPPESKWKCCGHCDDNGSPKRLKTVQESHVAPDPEPVKCEETKTEVTEKTDTWEDPSKILKESFGKLEEGLTELSLKETKPTATRPKKKVSFSIFDGKFNLLNIKI